jgi:streptogramin lyase
LRKGLVLILIIALVLPQLNVFNQQSFAKSLQNANPVYGEIELGNSTLPLGIATASDGGVWVAEANEDAVVHISQAGFVERIYSFSSQKHLAFVWSMVEDRYGALWIADETEPYLIRLNITSGSISHVSTGGVRPYSLAYDNNSNTLWFTSFDDSALGYLRITSTNGTLVDEKKIQGSSGIGAGPSGIALGPDGNIYVSESLNSSIAEYYSSNINLIHDWILPSSSQPVGLSFDMVKNLLWFTNHATSFFGFINLTSNTITQYSTSLAYSQGLPIVSLPYWIHQSSNGITWFNEHFGNRIAAFNLTSRSLVEYIIPENNSSPLQLVVDDVAGKVWFTEFTTGIVGYIDENSLPSKNIVAPLLVNLSPFNTNFEIDVPGGSSPLLLSGDLNRVGVIGTNMSSQISSLHNGSVYQVTLSGISMSYGNYTLTACIPSQILSGSQQLKVNICKVIYISYSISPSQANSYLIFLVLAVIAIAVFYFLYQRRTRKIHEYGKDDSFIESALSLSPVSANQIYTYYHYKCKR